MRAVTDASDVIGPSALPSRSVGLVAVAAIFAFAFVLQSLASPVTDVSWLLVVGDRVLSGDRLYVDIWESNPPLAVFLYFPAVLAEHALGVKAETAVLMLVLLAAACSVAFAVRALRSVVPDEDQRLALALALALTWLPFGIFGQREHIALVLEIPILACAAIRAAGATPRAWESVAAGVAAGLAIAIKPQFALPILFAYSVAGWRRRSMRPLFVVETWTAAAIVLSYGLLVLGFFPAFFDTIAPLAAETYRRAASPVAVLGFGISWLYLGLLAVASWREWATDRQPFAPVLLFSSLGFFLAYLEQGKGWPYHLYPALALVLLVLLLDLAIELPRLLGASRRGETVATAARLCVYVLVVAVALGASVAVRRFADLNFLPRELAAAVREVAPPRPRVLAVADDIAVGHPLTRLVDGTWAGTVAGQWISESAAARAVLNPGDDAAAAAYRAALARDRAMLARDLRGGQPDILLIDRRDKDYLAWMRADPTLEAALDQYQRAATFRDIEIWRRSASR
jgi:hypothetical protein